MRRNVLKRAITAVALSMAMLSQAVTVPAAEAKTFEDVSATAWYATPVDFCVQNGYFHGMTDTTFGPSVKLSRAMMVTTLWNMAGNPAPEKTTNFPDVKSSNWFYKAVQWAAGVGIVKGNGDGTFAPSKNISRQEVATMLKNFASFEGKDIKAAADISGYADIKSVASYAKPSVSWAVNYKIISGKDKGTKLDPKGEATRAEAASMLMNYCKNVKSNVSWDNTIYKKLVQYTIDNGVAYYKYVDGEQTDTIKTYECVVINDSFNIHIEDRTYMVYDVAENSLNLVRSSGYFSSLSSDSSKISIVLYEANPLMATYVYEYNSYDMGSPSRRARATYSCKVSDVKKGDTFELTYTDTMDNYSFDGNCDYVNERVATMLAKIGYTMADLGFTAY